MSKQTILTPVGRIVAGNLYKGSDKDGDGNPRVIKSGPNKGQPTVQFYIAVAIPKRPGIGWWQEEWGQKIYAAGQAAFPQACQAPTFAWKVKDGDSQIPNTKGKRPCDQEGFPGNWVVSFASQFAPKIFNKDGTEQLLTPDAVKPGFYVQVYGTVDGNGSQQKPGVFLNHNMVAFVAYGEEIVTGPDASAVGFGQNVQLPPGASAAPLAGSFNPAAPAVPAAMPGMPAPPAGVPSMPGASMPGSVPGMPAMPGAPMMPGAPVGVPGMPGAPAAVPGMPGMGVPPAPMAVAPHPGFLTPPGMPVAPPPAAPVRQMTAKAQGATYEQLIANGWTDQVLIQQGLMLA